MGYLSLTELGGAVPENRLDQALEPFRTALSVDPLSPLVNTNYAVMLMMARRYPDALAQFQKGRVRIR